ncbi:MAG: RNA 3'-terminal phosphate cyclase [Candidatus Caldarchaeum sp.]|uniref:RNA 3'-terminal phosphate cyclase n=1 Tax=Caldiarchaeum subterraneum TaxID=311458 RepID=A0A7C5Q3Z1_CALS0
MEDYVELDGSIGEGGGQVLRIALALSAVLSKPLHITNIRRKRQNPGLRSQHLTAVNAVQKACSARVRQAFIGSTELYFTPNRISTAGLELDTGTAGSTMLVLQSLLPVLCFSPSQTSFTIRGGTNNPNAPTYEYFERVFLPSVASMAVDAELTLLRRGFYPRGNGLVKGLCRPVRKLNPIKLTGEPEVLEVKGVAYTSRLPSHVADRMAKSCEKYLVEKGFENVYVEKEALTEADEKCAVDAGAGICLIALCENGVRIGVDRLGERGVPAEKVGQAAAEDLVSELQQKAPVDRHLGDMLSIYAALADGRSVYEVTRLTNHTVTSLQICEIIAGCRVGVHGSLNDKALIEVDGIGLVNRNLKSA